MHFSDNTEIMETGAQSMVTSELSNGESTDAIEDFRLTLKNLIQKLARGIALNAPSDELKVHQGEATRIKNCILFLMKQNLFLVDHPPWQTHLRLLLPSTIINPPLG